MDFMDDNEAAAHAQEEGASIQVFTTIDARLEGWECGDVYTVDSKPPRAQHVAPYLVGSTEQWDKVACGLTSEDCAC